MCTSTSLPSQSVRNGTLQVSPASYARMRRKTLSHGMSPLFNNIYASDSQFALLQSLFHLCQCIVGQAYTHSHGCSNAVAADRRWRCQDQSPPPTCDVALMFDGACKPLPRCNCEERRIGTQDSAIVGACDWLLHGAKCFRCLPSKRK